MISGAGDLAARYVIHAVGPVWHGGSAQEAELLAAAELCSLQVACEHHLTSISLSSLSTGWLSHRASQLRGFDRRRDFLTEHQRQQRVRLVLFGPAAYDEFPDALEELRQQGGA